MNGGIEPSIIDQIYDICKPKDTDKELQEKQRKLTVIAENLHNLALECFENPNALIAIAELYKEFGYNNLCGRIIDELQERFPLEFHNYITKNL